MTAQHIPRLARALGRRSACLLAGAAAALLLSACGAQTEAEITQTPAPPPASEPAPPASESAPPATQLAGLYQGSISGNASREFLALVVPETDKTVHVYGWYYNADDSHLAHLYDGQLALGILGSAANVPQTWRVIEGSNSYPASANVSASSLNQLTASIAVSRSTVTTYQLSANALGWANYDFNRPPPDVSTSRWDGYWSSRTDTFAGSLQFGAAAALDATATLWPCLAPGAPQAWEWTAQSYNTYKVRLSLGPNTYCPSWQNRQMAGVATVSVQNGRTQLDMMLLDGTGAGISYRGTR